MAVTESVDPLAGEPGLTKIRDLGSGSFGSVILYQRTYPYEEEVAIKFIQRNSTVDYVLIGREVRSHALLNHPHVIQFKRLGLSTDARYVYMMMEYADHGDMFRYLQKRGRFTESDARWFFQQVVIGLDYCHKRGVVNRDLKLENLLLKSISGAPLPLGAIEDPRGLHCKIADFGLCKKSITSVPKSRVGTLYYMAPEVLVASVNTPYDHGADVWSAGVILYVLLFKAYPFGVISERDNKAQRDAVLTRIRTADWSPPANHKASGDCLDLLHRILVADPLRRSTLSDIMRHPWFTVDLPPGVVEFNDQLVAEQAAEPPRCEQTHEELELTLQRAQELPIAPVGGAVGDNAWMNVGDSTIDSQIDAFYDEHPSQFDDGV